MSLLSPFKGLRPVSHKVHLVTTKAPKFYHRDVLRFRLRSNPFSFFSVLRPAKGRTQGRLPLKQRLTSVQIRFNQYCKADHLLEEKIPACYLYRQISPYGEFNGIVGTFDLKHFDENRIRIHEETIVPRVQLFQTFLEECRFHAEPILIAHEDKASMQEVKEKVKAQVPVYDFTSTDGIRHTMWPIFDVADLSTLTHAIDSLEKVYVADGHHRLASSLNARATIGEGKCLALYVPEHEIVVQTFRWIIKDLNRLEPEQLISALEENFTVERIPEFKRPAVQGEILAVFNQQFFKLKPQRTGSAPMDQIDQHFVRKTFLRPILGIQDIRNDPRIQFEPDLDDHLDLDLPLTFFYAPLTIDQIKTVADHDLKLPPKTTFVLPKLRTALNIYRFD